MINRVRESFQLAYSEILCFSCSVKPVAWSRLGSWSLKVRALTFTSQVHTQCYAIGVQILCVLLLLLLLLLVYVVVMRRFDCR